MSRARVRRTAHAAAAAARCLAVPVAAAPSPPLPSAVHRRASSAEGKMFPFAFEALSEIQRFLMAVPSLHRKSQSNSIPAAMAELRQLLAAAVAQGEFVAAWRAVALDEGMVAIAAPESPVLLTETLCMGA